MQVEQTHIFKFHFKVGTAEYNFTVSDVRDERAAATKLKDHLGEVLKELGANIG